MPKKKNKAGKKKPGHRKSAKRVAAGKQAARTRKRNKAAKARNKKGHSKKRKKSPKRGCGKHNWSKGGNARWKCKPGHKKHVYKSKKK